MNFPIPKNASDMVLYIWKIIDLQTILINDLLYSISFELFLLSPDKAVQFVNKAIQTKLLIKNQNNNISLSNNLAKRLQTWQVKRKEVFLSNLKLEQEKTTDDKSRVKLESNFNTIFKVFSDKSTINRATAVSKAAFDIIKFDSKIGIIKAKIKGTQEESYSVEIDLNNKNLQHNCHDFQVRRAKNKEFCKHLAKLFLILKERNKTSATKFLNVIAENINDWEFSG